MIRNQDKHETQTGHSLSRSIGQKKQLGFSHN